MVIMLEQLDLQPGHRVLEIGADFIMYEPDLENQTEKVYFITRLMIDSAY